MTPLPFSIDAWSAWAPNHDALEAWASWAKKPVPLGGGAFFDEKNLARWVDPMLRRRSRKLSRAMLEIAGRLTTPESRRHIASVFAHRYGETETTFPLLCDLAEQKPLSPMGFSLSVHNTASGLFSIAAGNHSPTTSVAAGKNSFVTGLLTACTFVQNYGACLFLIGDDKLSEVYATAANVLDETQQFYALGLLLSKNGPHRAHLECLAQPLASAHDPANPLPQPLRFLQALLNGETQIDFGDDGFNYQLRLPSTPLQSVFKGADAQQT